jgi:hypothetical protein
MTQQAQEIAAGKASTVALRVDLQEWNIEDQRVRRARPGGRCTFFYLKTQKCESRSQAYPLDLSKELDLYALLGT